MHGMRSLDTRTSQTKVEFYAMDSSWRISAKFRRCALSADAHAFCLAYFALSHADCRLERLHVLELAFSE